jgi:aromatic-amino-acid transaminase
MFQHVPPYAGDPILTLNESFGQDPRTDKINLSIGVYYDDQGRLPIMRAVREALPQVAQQIQARPYLPMEGLATYRQAIQHLLFGQDHEALQTARVATVQTLGGSGALKVGADFLKAHFPSSSVFVSDPTWDNHRALFEGAGFSVGTYPYYDAATGGLKFPDMLSALQALPTHSIVVLHACCHNPTGVDLSISEWAQLIPVIQSRQLIPFVDMAYQGFGEGLEADAFAIRLLADAGVSFLCANSFSKNFSLYGERVGALSVVCPTSEQAKQVLGQLKLAVRKNYSSPPTFGAQLVAHILQTPSLQLTWIEELQQMRTRIQQMRNQLHQVLTQRRPDYDFSYFLKQKGMFSYTGLTTSQADQLRDELGVYILRSGRICMAGLNSNNVVAVGEAIGHVV